MVRQLEAGGATLEESLALWERGEQLATICQEWLDGAKARLDAIRPNTDPENCCAQPACVTVHKPRCQCNEAASSQLLAVAGR